jgi:hypothetical protein
VPYASADDLFRWAAAVARNLALDGYRRRSHLELVESPDRPATTDVAGEVEARMLLESVIRCLARLSTRDQTAVLSGLEHKRTDCRATQIRLAVARHRARNRLRHLLGGPGGALGWLWLRRPRARVARLVLAVAVLAPSVWLIDMRDQKSDVGRPPQQVSVIPPNASPLLRGSSATATAPKRVESAPKSEAVPPGSHATAGAAGAIPPVHVDLVPTSYGRGHVAIRPARPDDHLLCLSIPDQPDRCADAPSPMVEPLP